MQIHAPQNTAHCPNILFFQVSDTAPPPSPSATERKFGYRSAFDDMDANETVEQGIITTQRCSMLLALVKGLLCLQCGPASLVIHTVDHQLGLVCAMETCCTECGAMINKTLSSDRLDGSTSGNVPFVVVQLAVAASMDMGVGHAGLVRLCHFLDMRPLSHKTFAKHVRAICETNKIVVTRVFDEAAQVVRRVYRALDPSTGDNKPPH